MPAPQPNWVALRPMSLFICSEAHAGPVDVVEEIGQHQDGKQPQSVLLHRASKIAVGMALSARRKRAFSNGTHGVLLPKTAIRRLRHPDLFCCSATTPLWLVAHARVPFCVASRLDVLAREGQRRS